jgi:hypothetical protein|tara:strand:- start:39 stop:266 length:228 start_codon:yes stop_codon:yes gene_type:complete
MDIAIFVLVISMSIEPEIWEYKGHFVNCQQANEWRERHYPKAQATKCLLEEYFYMPKNIKKRTFDIRDKKGRRIK